MDFGTHVVAHNCICIVSKKLNLIRPEKKHGLLFGGTGFDLNGVWFKEV